MTTTLQFATQEQFSPATIAWATLEKVAGKVSQRDDLAPGAHHHVVLSVSGHVDDVPFTQEVAAVLTVGHDQKRASSVTPELTSLVAYLLSKLNDATRKRILLDLPTEFAERGTLPETPREIVGAAQTLLRELRSKQQIDVRGPVHCEYRITEFDPDTGPAAAALRLSA